MADVAISCYDLSIRYAGLYIVPGDSHGRYAPSE